VCSVTVCRLAREISVGVLAIFALGDDGAGRRCVAVQPVAVDVREDPVPMLRYPRWAFCETCGGGASGTSVSQAGRQGRAVALTAWWPDGLQGGQGRTESVRDEAGCSVRIDEGCSRRCVKDLHSRRRHLAVESVAHVRTWVSAAGSGTTHTLGSQAQ
jgi:hypothetical protein